MVKHLICSNVNIIMPPSALKHQCNLNLIFDDRNLIQTNKACPPNNSD